MSDRVPRDLTEQEAAVLAAMLSVASQQYSVGTLRVTGTCKCGCPTIHFNDSPNARLLAKGGVRDSTDVVLLFVDEAGGLSSLELVWVSDQPPAALPPPSSLVPVESGP